MNLCAPRGEVGAAVKELVTAREIAAALGVKWRWAKRRARAERWPVASISCRNHVRFYRLAGLPADVRLALARRAAAETPAPPALVNGHASALKVLAPRAQMRAHARLELIRLADVYVEASGLSRGAALAAFAADYSAGRIAIDLETRAAIGAVSPGSLRRWRRALRAFGIGALSGRYGARKGRSMIAADAEIAEFIAAMLAGRPHAKAAHVIAAIRARFGRDRAPAYRTLQRYLARLKDERAIELLALANPDAARGRHMPAFGCASEGVERLNQLWEMDSTPADVMLVGEDGKPHRHAIIGVIDVLSHRGKLLVSKTSRSAAIASLVRRAILAWGVPEKVKTDQGQDYTSLHIDRALAALEIVHEYAPPYTPEAKPHIERFFGTLSRQLFEHLPGYVGHDVAERRAIESRRSFAARRGLDDAAAFSVALTPEELQDRCDRWCDEVYARAPQKALGGRSPFETAAAWRGAIRKVADERALDLLLSEAPGNGYRKVGKKGIAVDCGLYIHPALGALVGQRVQVCYDDADLGRIYVFGADDGGFVCAAEDPERTGMDRRAVAIEAKRNWREACKALRAGARAAIKEQRPLDSMDEILQRAGEEAARIVAFPRAAAAYETPALAEAAKAAEAARIASTRARPGRPRQLSDEERAEEEARRAAARAAVSEAERADVARAEIEREESLRRIARARAWVEELEGRKVSNA